MTRYLLDTNIISFYVKQTFPALTMRMHRTPSTSLLISVVNEAELRYGLSFLPSQAKARLATEDLLRNIAIEPWDSRCARQFASLGAAQRRAGKSLDTADAMIAAHALAYDCVLVSNDAVFRQVQGLRIEDWTKGPQQA